jgi:predicted membrane protein
MVAVKQELDHTAQLQGEIWKIAIAGKAEGGQPVVVGVLPVLNQMFDIVTTRAMATKTHPPSIVFFMLIMMAFAASFMAGHGMSGCKVRSWVHSIGFAATLAITVFVIVDMEHPRFGIIRVDSFDQVLMDLHRSMQ